MLFSMIQCYTLPQAIIIIISDSLILTYFSEKTFKNEIAIA
jgi:hypothetical protein